jgi:hypothetical protein
MAGVINEVQAALREPSRAEPLDLARLAPQVSRRQFVQTSVAGSIVGALATWALSDQTSWGSARGLPAGREPRELSAPRPRLAADRIPLHAAVFDERFAEAVRFGAAARERGLGVRGLRGDVTDLWYEELQPLWTHRAVPIAGLTAYAALFCLERLAWDHRMRLIYRGAHTPLENGQVEHVLALPKGISVPIRTSEPAILGASAVLDAARDAPIGHGVDTARDASAAHADWPVEIASMIAQIESRGGWTGLPQAHRSTELRCRTPRAPLVRDAALAHGASPAPVAPQTLHSWVIAPPRRA